MDKKKQRLETQQDIRDLLTLLPASDAQRKLGEKIAAQRLKERTAELKLSITVRQSLRSLSCTFSRSVLPASSESSMSEGINSSIQFGNLV